MSEEIPPLWSEKTLKRCFFGSRCLSRQYGERKPEQRDEKGRSPEVKPMTAAGFWLLCVGYQL